jgi:hypothetical protein
MIGNAIDTVVGDSLVPASAIRSAPPALMFNPPCFTEGTRILTMRGEVAVEHLSSGDAIVLTNGEIARLMWLGYRRIDLARHRHPEQMRPVLIEAGAIAKGVPARDLLVSPDLTLHFEDLLIPAARLINGFTIRQVALETVTYYHVELPVHTVLYAEQTATGSYCEPGNRGAFAKSGAPFAMSGPLVERVRRRLLARAAITTTSDPAMIIHRRADGAALIESRSAIPGHITQDPRDRRRLGIKIATLTIDGVAIPLDRNELTEGWHDPEPDGRWTDGAALIPAALLAGLSTIEVSVAATMLYPLDRATARPRHRLR